MARFLSKTDFCDRVAVVTGAASGMGRALSWELGRAGARLALIDRDEAGLQRLHEELGRAGLRSAIAIVDVTDCEALHSAIRNLTDRLGPAEILIPCAGICGLDLVEKLDVEQIEKILRVNYLGVIHALDAVLPGMIERRSGRIVALISMTAIRGIPFEAAYGASKAALQNFLESLRPALRRRGIQVTMAYPGFVQTPLLEDLMQRGMARPPGVIDAERVARAILAAARRGDRIVSVPRSLKMVVELGRLLPPFLYDQIMTRLARRFALPY
jgi:short-subunit dehydrogenase